ncbi:DUF305 domain-containing protein [Umezawaea endophytica]|uniref:DUF305 domain-containing protein n=1 Tax=Umezawaea endophytica TaxID=1654476 RepID=A0A9X2VR74_9PSEU|nr:DUF305 domain-containing protein [Umezawaea endophytica]MCS7481383.1 DUF305 domain-containing protein [Umezawaea endophytica]
MLRAAAPLLTLLLLTACAAPQETHAAHVHPSPPPSSSAAAVPGGFSETDAAYVQLAIPQDETLLPVLALAKSREGVDPALAGLAAEVQTGHQQELERLRKALADAGRTYLNMHEGHDMPGMVTADELAALTNATGQAFDDLLRTLLRAHFEESTTVAKSELAAGSSPEVLDVTRGIESSRAAYLARLGST